MTTEPHPPTVDPQTLAAAIAGKLCHDVISPSGAILSGLDLFNDPSAQDMRDDAVALIQQSADKLAALVRFCRVAYGTAGGEETFDTQALGRLVADLTRGGRAELDWQVPDRPVDRTTARILVNLAAIAHAALPSGGQARITTRDEEAGTTLIVAEATGSRARLKPEVSRGLVGQDVGEGLTGQWIQPYWLWLSVRQAGGDLTVDLADGLVDIRARLPQTPPDPTNR